MRLRRNQLCPIHHSRSCCRTEVIPKTPTAKQLGFRRIEDPHHPRGYRELRSNWEMRKLLNRKPASQCRKCALCGAEFTDYSDGVPDHINPRGWEGMERRSSGQYSGGPLVMQWGKGINKNLISIKAFKSIWNSPIPDGGS
jgi:hypothetical protein